MHVQVMSKWLTGFNETIQAAAGVSKPLENSQKGGIPILRHSVHCHTTQPEPQMLLLRLHMPHGSVLMPLQTPHLALMARKMKRLRCQGRR